jgi:hypothetical protein
MKTILGTLARLAKTELARATALEQLAKANHAVAATWPEGSDTRFDYARRADGATVLAGCSDHAADQYRAAIEAIDEAEPGSEEHLLAVAEGAQLLRGGIEGAAFRDYLEAQGGLTEAQADEAVCLWEARAQEAVA